MTYTDSQEMWTNQALKVVLALLLVPAQGAWSQVAAVAPELPILITSDDGETASGGQSVDLVREAVRRAGLTVTIKIQPWPRALLTATNRAGTLLFPVARTPDRETQFDWLGPVNRLEYRVFRLAEGGAPQVKSADELKPFRVGVLLGDIADEYFTSAGAFSLERVRNYDLLINLLFARRVDYLAVVPSSLYSALRQSGRPQTAVSGQFVLPTGSTDPYSYAVMAKGSPPELEKRIADGFKDVVADGTWERIFRQYQ